MSDRLMHELSHHEHLRTKLLEEFPDTDEETVNGGAKRDHLGGVRRDRLAAAGLSP